MTLAKPLRLDIELVRRGLAPTRNAARRAIDEGLVTVRGLPASAAATLVSPGVPIALVGPPRRFVSRGGDKLDGALERLGVEVEGRRWLDAGASTGGFTDCLLQRGAATVVAADVGYGQLDWSLRNDPRVVVLERTNVRHLTAEMLPFEPDAVTADLSFISLAVVLPALVRVARPQADFVLLVKPQFEAGRRAVGKGGVVRDPAAWTRAMASVVEAGRSLGPALAGAVPSAMPGPAGNREFFVHLRDGAPEKLEAIESAVKEVGPGGS